MDEELEQYLDAKFAELHVKRVERAASPMELRAATHAAMLRATDPALEALTEGVLKNCEQTLRRRRL
jgi:hypothetical protein